MKVGREKYFPAIHNSGWQAAAANLCDYRWKKSKTLVKTNTSLEFISLRSPPLTLMSFLRELQWSWVKKTTPVKFTHIQDGYESFSLAVSDLKDTFFGLYIFHTRSQGVTALVSVSDGKIQITILILRRGPCLPLPSWRSLSDSQVIWRTGRQKAPVLPLPVSAAIRTSPPPRTSGIASAWKLL